MITVDTKLIALLGDPLRQSFSTRMQNVAFRELGLDFEYFPIEVGTEHIGEIVKAIRHMNFAGFACTKPNKVAIIPFLDEMDELAEKIGAVNTVVIKNGRLKGYNTDGEGFVRSLMRNYNKELEQSAFFCFGAGGSARAVCSTLAAHGTKKIYITDLYNKYAALLGDEINKKFRPIAEVIPYEDKDKIHRCALECDVVMNHSGVGMFPHPEKSPANSDIFRPGHLAFDATYNPDKTQFLKDAEAKGAASLNGLGMLVHQGAIQFKMWTGHDEPVESMYRTVRQILAEMDA